MISAIEKIRAMNLGTHVAEQVEDKINFNLQEGDEPVRFSQEDRDELGELIVEFFSKRTTE